MKNVPLQPLSAWALVVQPCRKLEGKAAQGWHVFLGISRVMCKNQTENGLNVEKPTCDFFFVLHPDEQRCCGSWLSGKAVYEQDKEGKRLRCLRGSACPTRKSQQGLFQPAASKLELPVAFPSFW